jgi:hypothetical protein
LALRPFRLPDLLEGLALMRLEGETERVIFGEKIFQVQERIAAAPSDEPYAAWARAHSARPLGRTC